MKIRELEETLNENLNKLVELYEKGEATESEVKRYKEYIKKTLFAYKVIEGKNLQQQTSK